MLGHKILLALLALQIGAGDGAGNGADDGAPNHLINFDVYPDNSPVMNGDTFTTQWASWGVIFTPCGPSNNACSYSAPNHAFDGSNTITAIFVDPCTRQPMPTRMVGTRQDWCWVNGEGIDMFIYDSAGNLLDHQFNAGGGNLVTFSYAQPIIARIQMNLVLQGIDDFVFEQPPGNPCPADTTHDGAVNVADLLLLINNWGPCGNGPCPGNVNCDDIVNVADLLAMINAWGSCP